MCRMRFAHRNTYPIANDLTYYLANTVANDVADHLPYTVPHNLTN